LNSKNRFAFVLVVGDAKDFPRGQQIVRNQGSTWRVPAFRISRLLL